MRMSLYDWCIQNNRNDILDRFDYDKNKFSPKDVNGEINIKWNMLYLSLDIII